MKTDDKKIQSFYEDYIKKQGVTNGWPSVEYGQKAYFAASNCSHQKWNSFKSILDVGSGEGHFLDFLRKNRGFKGRYTGLELLPMFHETAIKQYGNDTKSEFINAEFLEYDFDSKKFDWVISLGGLSVKQKHQAEYDLAFLTKMVDLSCIGISIYLNDIERIERTMPGRLEKLPDLAAHKVEEFVSMTKKILPNSNIKLYRFPTSESHSTLVHITLT